MVREWCDCWQGPSHTYNKHLPALTKTKVMLVGHMATVNIDDDKTIISFYDNSGPLIQIWCLHHDRVGAIDVQLWVLPQRSRWVSSSVVKNWCTPSYNRLHSPSCGHKVHLCDNCHCCAWLWRAWSTAWKSVTTVILWLPFQWLYMLYVSI